MSSHTWDRSFYTSMIGRLLLVFQNNELENLDKQLLLPRASSTVEIINAFIHYDHCVRRYERESVAVCVVSVNYGECDTATRRMVTARNCDAALKKRRHGQAVYHLVKIKQLVTSM